MEVDVVIERGGLAVAGIEVKASATVNPPDFKGLRKLKRTAGDRFAAGVVLYDGEITAGFGDGMFAGPLRVLFDGPGVSQLELFNPRSSENRIPSGSSLHV